MHGSANPLLNLLSSIALGFIFEVVLSLMALIFAYDALAGERERGTLRLVLTNAISRGHILLAKYISAMTCLLVPLIISLALRADFADEFRCHFAECRRFSPHRVG